MGMKRKILLTISYLIETDENNFWNKENGYLHSQIDDSLKKRFPKKMKLSNAVKCQRYCLMHRIIDYTNANIVTCPICKRLLTDRAKPNPIEGLDYATKLKDVLMCSRCAWQLELDVEIHGIEHVLNRFKD